jgi:hypothetical protein
MLLYALLFRVGQVDMQKPIVIQSAIADDEILALATDIATAQFETWQAFGTMLRRVLPRVLEGWTADDISEMTLGDLKALPEQLVRAVELRKTLIKLPNA